MKKMKQRIQQSRKRGAVSPIISTLIISAAILAITVVASFLSLNVLELQSQNAEFNQAKSNMQILAEIIDDTSVKPGSGSFIQFNERTGGVGYENNSFKTLSLVVLGEGNDGSKRNITTLTNNPLNVTYRAGRLVSTYPDLVKPLNNLSYTDINETNTLIVSGLSNQLGLLTQQMEGSQQESGARIKLDFNRVRIVNSSLINVGIAQYRLFTVTFYNIYVTPLSFTGSGSLDVKVQNNGTSTTKQFTYLSSSPINIIATYGDPNLVSPLQCDIGNGCFNIPKDESKDGVVVMVTIIDIDLSTLG